MKTDNKILAESMRILAQDIQSDDGIANSAIYEAACRIEELAGEIEILRIQLSACGVLAMSNTEDSLKENFNMKPEYLCASVQDVHDAVLREIALRKENTELKQCIEDLISTKVSLQRKALKAKTNIVKAQVMEEILTAWTKENIPRAALQRYTDRLRQGSESEK